MKIKVLLLIIASCILVCICGCKSQTDNTSSNNIQILQAEEVIYGKYESDTTN